ncbi:MAG: hypothetical protein PHV37_08785 [Candidatus Gastranaerophilales bacterium]|nr:hypothetical protein [Candidatus Gastranaerophilales bacterium]
MLIAPLKNEKLLNNLKYSSGKVSTPVFSGKTDYKSLNADVFDDGKISTKEKAKHFAKGVISPIANLFKSPKNLAIGAGVLFAGALVTAALPPMLPVMAALGVATGAFQIGKSAVKAATAKTDKAAEQAWEGIGAGSFSIGASALSAKSSLKAAGKDIIVKTDCACGNGTRNMKMAEAVVECFKSIPENLSKSAKMIKNKTAFTNLKGVFLKPVNTREADDISRLQKIDSSFGKDKLDELQRYAEQLHDEGVRALGSQEACSGGCVDELKAVLPEDMRDIVTFRVKGASSIKDKLITRMTADKERIIKEAQKAGKAPDYTSMKRISNVEEARAEIGDLIGTRVSLDKVDSARVDSLLEALTKALRDGKIKFTEIDNYTGKDITPYFSDSQIETLMEAAKAGGAKGTLAERTIKYKNSGYTTSQVNIEYKDGTLGEFQIRGKHIDKLADVEHIPYDLSQSKDLSGGNPLLKTLYRPLEAKVKSLSQKGYEQYNGYLRALYRHYRDIERGAEVSAMPNIADFIDNNPKVVLNNGENLTAKQSYLCYKNILKALDIDNIEKLHNDAGWISKLPRTTIVKAMMGGANTYLAENNIVNDKT